MSMYHLTVAVVLFVGCLTPQQHASVSQGRVVVVILIIIITAAIMMMIMMMMTLKGTVVEVFF